MDYDTTMFQEKQNKIIEKRKATRKKEQKYKEKHEKEQKENNKKIIKEFYKQNQQILINETLDTFMTQLNKETSPPYTVNYEFTPNSYMGFYTIVPSKPTDSRIYFENMIKKELRKNIGNIGKITVTADIVSEENGYWSGCQWCPRDGKHLVMYVKISLDF